jgi:hypothetical protein
LDPVASGFGRHLSGSQPGLERLVDDSLEWLARPVSKSLQGLGDAIIDGQRRSHVAEGSITAFQASKPQIAKARAQRVVPPKDALNALLIVKIQVSWPSR